MRHAPDGLTRRPGTSPLLPAIAPLLGPLPPFADPTHACTASVPKGATRVSVTPTCFSTTLERHVKSTSADGSADLSIEAEFTSTGSSPSVNLASGGDAQVAVRTADGASASTYAVTVRRQPAAFANFPLAAAIFKLDASWDAPPSAATSTPATARDAVTPSCPGAR